MLPFEDILRINQYAQGVVPRAEAVQWFRALLGDKKRNVLRQLSVMLQEAGARPTDLSPAIQDAGLKPTHTPAVLMARGPFRIQATKVIHLPESSKKSRTRYC